MNKSKFIKVTLVIVGLAAISYGGFRAYEYFSGIQRLEYSKIRIVEFETPPISEPLPE